MTRGRRLVAMAGAVALAVPVYPAAPKAMVLPTCAGKTVSIPMQDDGPKSRHDCCGKACHAGNDRKRKGTAARCC